MMCSHRNSRRAVALVVVLGVLFVLATLAISFARSMSVEQDAAASRSDEVQARFCAAAGMEHAIEAIRKASREPFDSPNVPWFYTGTSGLDAGNGVPLEYAAEPSFKIGTTAYGRAYSGILPETYESEGDTYVVKVLDAASMINLNMQLDPRRAIAEQPLVRMLDNLSKAITRYEPYKSLYPGDSNGPLYSSSGQALADDIVNYRQSLTGQKFENKTQILDISGLGINAAKFRFVQDYLTVDSWADPSVVAAMDPAVVPKDGDLVSGRVPTGTPLLRERSPINVNTAPAPVLIAVFQEVAALWIDRTISRSSSAEIHATGKAVHTTPVSESLARTLADAIVLRRKTNPFRHWTDFKTFIAANVADLQQKDAILANCDPNVNTHRANPDETLWREVDKFDLLASTTEICFNSCGVFEIESLGRVTFNGGFIRAQALIRAVASIFQIYRETTQSQFESGKFTKRVVRIPIVTEIRHAVISQGNARVNGTVDFTGKAGGIHTNGDLELIGGPSFDQDATASGGFSTTGGETVGGASGGGYDVEPIPTMTPSDHKGSADFIFRADGTVVTQSGSVVGNGSHRGFTFSGGEWKWNSGDTSSGTYYFEGNVDIRGNTGGTTWKVTIYATGHVSVGGNVKISPNDPNGIAVLAGTDIGFQGNPSGGGLTAQGVYYAGEQIDFGGTVNFHGAALAKNASASDKFVTETNMNGTVHVHYDGGLTFVTGYEEYEVENLARYPDSKTHAQFNGYDGYIGRAPLTTSKAYLGGIPYVDALLANWDGATGLDADFGGGSLSMVRDAAGPDVEPIAGATAVGHLLRDGYYSEQDAVGGYTAVDNIGSTQGAIQFWFKPSWAPYHLEGGLPIPVYSSKTHQIFAMSRESGGSTQAFYLVWNAATNTLVYKFDRFLGGGVRNRSVTSTTAIPLAHVWTHFVLVYDLLEPDPAKAIALFVNGAPIPGAIHNVADSSTLDPGQQLSATVTAGNTIRLGERPATVVDSLPGTAPEGTFDGFMTVGEKKDVAWAQQLYSEGRYYAGTDATYTSRDLPIPPGADILHSAWTIHYPENWTGKPVVEIGLYVGATKVKQTVDPTGIIGGVDDVSGVVTYRLEFQTGPAVPALYETPFVDDVTIAYSTTTRIHLWEELRSPARPPREPGPGPVPVPQS